MSVWEAGRFATWRRALDGGVVLSASYLSTDKYSASVDGRRLVRTFPTLEEAQRAAEGAARRIFAKGLTDLGPATPSEQPIPEVSAPRSEPLGP